jgi:hypothetical protein
MSSLALTNAFHRKGAEAQRKRKEILVCTSSREVFANRDSEVICSLALTNAVQRKGAEAQRKRKEILGLYCLT